MESPFKIDPRLAGLPDLQIRQYNTNPAKWFRAMRFALWSLGVY
jgi:hypothetical protein